MVRSNVDTLMMRKITMTDSQVAQLTEGLSDDYWNRALLSDDVLHDIVNDFIYKKGPLPDNISHGYYTVRWKYIPEFFDPLIMQREDFTATGFMLGMIDSQNNAVYLYTWDA